MRDDPLTPPKKLVVAVPMEAQHQEAVADLWHERLAAPDERIDEWTSAVLDPDNQTEGFVAVDGGQVRGFGICTFADAEWARDYLEHPTTTVDVWPVTGVIEAIAVDADWEGQGIASIIVDKELRYLAAHNVDGIVAVSWHRDDHADSRPLFEKFDFEPAATDEDYYAALDDDIYCVDCDGPCECGATVFVRSMEDN